MRTFLIVTLVSVLAGCGSKVVSSYTPYHSLPSDYRSKAVAVVPGNDSFKGSLEFANFKSRLEYKLRQVGFTISQDPSSADLLAYLNYGIDSGSTSTHVGSIPIYGQTGGGTTYHSGTASAYGTGGYATGSYSGSSYTMPTYGVVGSSAYSYKRTTYKRVLAIDILDRPLLDTGKTKKVYEVKLTSKGWCGQIAGVFDAMLEALFVKFPGENGKSLSTSVKWDRKTC